MAADALGKLWQRTFAVDATEPSRSELRDAARVIATASRAAGLLPEHLLVAVKESWAHGRPTSAEARERQRWVLTETISLCIGEYYDDAPPTATARDAGAGDAHLGAHR